MTCLQAGPLCVLLAGLAECDQHGARWDRRVMPIDRVGYVDGWPTIEGGQPSARANIPVIHD